ncbi:MAG: hypothetical protein RL213_1473 [Bacteroidota bacterium]
MAVSHTRMILRLVRESFLFAIEALRVNKLRTILSLLGITIGIFAIISVFTVTDSLERKIRKDIESLGSNVVYVQKWPWMPEDEGGEYPWWKYMNRPIPGHREMQELDRRLQTASAVAYVATINGQVVKYGSNSVENVTVLAVSQDYDKIKSLELSDGRYFSESESGSGKPIALLGYDLQNAMFPSGNAVGKQITVHGLKMTVIGTVAKEGKSLMETSADNCVIVPVNYARNIVNLRSDRYDPYILVKAREGINNQELKADLRGYLRNIRRLHPQEDNDFALNETSMLSNDLQDLFATLGIAGWIIGGFSILVGGFGIANIMFVSVKERTPVIGIQKSLGAKNYFILLQFLVESVFLCLIGGGIGLLAVYGLSSVATSLLDFDLTLAVNNVINGVVISAVIGIISGFVPALQASRMNPVDAIRAV